MPHLAPFEGGAEAGQARVVGQCGADFNERTQELGAAEEGGRMRGG